MSISTLSDINHAVLTLIVHAALDSSSAEVIDWQVTPIIQGKASPAGVYRVTGTALEQGKKLTWSLVLKELYADTDPGEVGYNVARDDPASEFYWRREVLLYQSGLFDHLPDGFAAPRCYQIDEQPGRARIWMEDVREDLGAMWPLDHYRNVARHFGRFNGLYGVAGPIPTWPWLLRKCLFRWMQESEWPEFSELYSTLHRENTLVQRGWNDTLIRKFGGIWQDRSRFLYALDQLPQTLQHNDSGRKNLIARRRASGDLETVAIDWGQAAIGPIGGELACLLSQPVYWFQGVRPEQLSELDEIAFGAYLQGLRDVGWQGDAALVRLGYTASMALRGSFGNFIIEWVAQDEGKRHWIETAVGRPIEDIVDAFRGFRSYVVACAEEAHHLMASLLTVRKLDL